VRDAALMPSGDAAPLETLEEVEAILDEHGVEFHTIDQIVLSATDRVAFDLVVPGDEAFTTWAALRELVPRTGRYPVVAGQAIAEGMDDSDPQAFDELADILGAPHIGADDEPSLEQQIAFTQNFDADAWFRERRLYLDIDPDELFQRGTLDDLAPTVDLLGATKYTADERFALVHIVLMPTSQSWDVPIHLGWGGWNDAPLPHEHAALFRYWAQEHGAHVVTMSSSSSSSSSPIRQSTAMP
jgi:hypothetical protein